jgi:membrane-associated phospholipid phosphatase
MASSVSDSEQEARAAEAYWPSPKRLASLCVGGVAGAVALGVAFHSGPTGFDTWLHDLVVEHRGREHAVARAITQAGSTRIIWPVVAVAALLFPRSRRWRRAATTLAFGGVAALAIGVRLVMSDLVRRPRPPTVDWAGTAGGFSFPSGHTTAATIGAGALGWALVRHLNRRWAQIAIWVAVAVYAGTVGWTRIWLGVHWPLDVVAGWSFGIGWISGMAALAVWVERRFPLWSSGERAASATGRPPGRRS